MLELGWVHGENAPALLRFLASQLWHDVGDSEWQRFYFDLDLSDAQRGAWVEFPLGPILSISVARDTPGAGRVLVRAQGADEWVSLVRGLVLFLRTYIVKGEA
jgi:hypothetical protein